MPTSTPERQGSPAPTSAETMGERRSLARGGALSFVGASASAGLGFLVILVAARTMGDEGAGLLFQAIGAFSIITVIAKLGLDSAALWRLPHLVDTSPHLLREHLRFVLVLTAASSMLAGLVTALVGHLLGRAHQAAGFADALVAISWAIPFGTGVLVAMAVARALGDLVVFVGLGNIALPLLRLVAVAAAAAAGLSAVHVSVAWAAASVPVCVALVVFAVRAVRPLEGPAPPTRSRWPSRGDRVRLLRYAAPRTVSAGLEQGQAWLNVIIVGALLGSAAAGIYGAASRFIAAGLIIDTALRIVLSPRFSVLLHRRDIPAARDLYHTATGWLVLLATPGLFLLAAFAPVCLGWLGPDFVQGAPALVVIVAGAVVTLLAGNVHTLLLMSGRSGWAAINKGVALTVSTVGTLVLAPEHGLVGAAVAWSVGQSLDALLATVEVHHLLGIQPPVAPAVLALVTSGLAVGGPALAARTLLGANHVGLAVGTVAGISVWCVSCFLLRGRLKLTGLRAAAP